MTEDFLNAYPAFRGELSDTDTAIASLWFSIWEKARQCYQPAPEPVATVQCINGVTIGYLEVMQPIGTKLYAAPVGEVWSKDHWTEYERGIAAAEREEIAEYLDRNLMSAREYADEIRARGNQ